MNDERRESMLLHSKPDDLLRSQIAVVADVYKDICDKVIHYKFLGLLNKILQSDLVSKTIK